VAQRRPQCLRCIHQPPLCTTNRLQQEKSGQFKNAAEAGSSLMDLSRKLFALVVIGAPLSLCAQQVNPTLEMIRDTSPAVTSTIFNSIVTGDFNNDGKPDFLVGGGAASNTLVLRLGNGDGSFQDPITVGTAANSAIEDMAVADFNNDGNLDLAVLSVAENDSGSAASLQIFFGNGDGTFQPPLTYTLPYLGYTIAAGDLNGDGYPDIAVGDYHGQVEIWNNSGGTSFAEAKAVTIVNAADAVQVRIGQFDGDGINHLATEVESQGVAIAWNDGHENFTLDVVDTSTTSSWGIINVGDVAQDGRDDIIFNYQCPALATNQPPACAYAIDVIYGQGNEKVIAKTVVSNWDNAAPAMPWAVDVNGDGAADLVAPVDNHHLGGYNVWLGESDSSFNQTPISYAATVNSVGPMYPADFDRNGKMDFVQSMEQETEIYLNSSYGSGCGVSEKTPTVSVCTPVNNVYLPSPVLVAAYAFDPNKVTALQEYIDNSLEYSTDQDSMSENFPLADGTHFLVTKAWDDTGLSFRSNRTITVYTGAPTPWCPIDSTVGSAICLPSSSTVSSPFQFLANGQTNNVPTGAQLYVDGDLVINDNSCNSSGQDCEGTTYINTTLDLTPGSHLLVFKLWDDAGIEYTTSKTITVN
jgi:FG-GAP-like repeat